MGATITGLGDRPGIGGEWVTVGTSLEWNEAAVRSRCRPVGVGGLFIFGRRSGDWPSKKESE